MRTISSSLLFSCFLRSYMVNAAYNPRGLQNIGFIFAIEPALEVLYGPGEALSEARMRYARHYNCHPFLTPMFLGVLLRLESAIAAGALQPSALDGIKDITANTLSALGDSFFSGTLLATWALVSSCLILAGLPESALWFTVQCFALLQLFKLASCILGFRKGMATLFLLRRLGLINWGDRFKCLNAGLLGLFLWLALPGASVAVWGGAALYLLFTGWLVGKCHVPRIFVALVLLMVTVALHLTGWFEQIPALWLW